MIHQGTVAIKQVPSLAQVNGISSAMIRCAPTSISIRIRGMVQDGYVRDIDNS